VISRRAVLGSTAASLVAACVAGAAAQRAGVLDDGLRAVGVRPHAEPDPRDVQLLAEAAAGQGTLLAQFDALRQKHDLDELASLRSVLTQQLAAVTNSERPLAPAPEVSNDKDEALTAFADQLRTTAKARYDGALTSGSLAVTQVLASMSAGLSQSELAVRTSL
jgi:hypothetical protein